MGHLGVFPYQEKHQKFPPNHRLLHFQQVTLGEDLDAQLPWPSWHCDLDPKRMDGLIVVVVLAGFRAQV